MYVDGFLTNKIRRRRTEEGLELEEAAEPWNEAEKVFFVCSRRCCLTVHSICQVHYSRRLIPRTQPCDLCSATLDEANKPLPFATVESNANQARYSQLPLFRRSAGPPLDIEVRLYGLIEIIY